MNQDHLIEILKDKGIEFALDRGVVTISGESHVYLGSLTSSGRDVKFENQGWVYLNSLESLPEGVKFENQGGVYLGSLTFLGRDVKFENQGGVDLHSLTTLPEGVKFENQGWVYLYSLESLPEDVKFENQGGVDLQSLTSPTQLYLGEKREFRNIDSRTMIITSKRKEGEFTIYRARYFGGGGISDLTPCYIAETNGLFAHGSTVKEAVEDVQFKLSENQDRHEVVGRIKESQTVSVADFRVLTGACREGMRQHLSEQGIDMDAVDFLPLGEALRAMSGTSYGDEFNRQMAIVTV